GESVEPANKRRRSRAPSQRRARARPPRPSAPPPPTPAAATSVPAGARPGQAEGLGEARVCAPQDRCPVESERKPDPRITRGDLLVDPAGPRPRPLHEPLAPKGRQRGGRRPPEC